MQRAALWLLATPGLMPTVGFSMGVSPSTGETLFNANGAHPRMPSGAGLQEKDTLDAHLHADETKPGKIVGDFDPVRYVSTVSGVVAHGGSLSGPGSGLANGKGYAVSGYAMWNTGMGGTALINRSVDRK